jgi:hypothetical protein
MEGSNSLDDSPSRQAQAQTQTHSGGGGGGDAPSNPSQPQPQSQREGEEVDETKKEEEELIEKAQKWIDKITSSPDNPNPTLLHALSSLLETQESLYAYPPFPYSFLYYIFLFLFSSLTNTYLFLCT